ncbi:MAG: hypothetical protein AUJ92_15570 [Armatimonadetes bacterium CG2_30_59_28]|nr:hypothetical protein [Armatimonadota bacterium]OIO91859.1 MAG: hypothetical protein AUJ92_15570 [Armatimonadetes bacterium CG2_30_59_28]
MSKLPAFKSAEELAEFVDTHDLTPYWENTVPADPAMFRVVRGKQTAMRVPLSRSAADKLRALAAVKGVPAPDLVRQWVNRHIKEESAAR